jgi:hypothetical protein
MLLAFMIAAPFFILPALLPAIVTARVSSWLIVPLMAPIGAIGPFAIGVAARALSRDRIARAYVWEGRCGACAFDLAGLEAAEDGCTVCPECGAAWVVRPSVQPTMRTPHQEHEPSQE